jgi:hypothetical protein
LKPYQLEHFIVVFLLLAEIAQCYQKLVVILIKLFFRLKLSKMYFTKNVVLNWYSSMKIFIRKIRDVFWHRKLTLNVQISWFLTTLCHLSITDNKKNFTMFEKLSLCQLWHIKRHNPNLVSVRCIINNWNERGIEWSPDLVLTEKRRTLAFYFLMIFFSESVMRG